MANELRCETSESGSRRRLEGWHPEPEAAWETAENRLQGNMIESIRGNGANIKARAKGPGR